MHEKYIAESSGESMAKLIPEKFKKLLPELLKLEPIIENNRSHNQQNVLDHTKLVYQNFLELLNKEPPSFYEEVIDKFNKKELLCFAALTHDLGKINTVQMDDGKTSCPDHERMSAEILKTVLQKFTFSSKEEEYILNVVINHGVFHNALDLPSDQQGLAIQNFTEKHAEIVIEIILLTKADLKGGDLKSNDQDLYNKKMDFLDNALTNFKNQ